MRIAVLLEQCLAPVPGGTARYSREVASALAGAAAAGDSVTGWTALHHATGPARVDGVGGPRRLPLGRRALAAAYERGLGPAPRGADLVHAPTLLAPPRRGRPLVVTVHDAVPWTHPETLTPRGVAWHRRMGERVARHADAVVVPTSAVADDLAAVLPLREGRVHVVGEGVGEALRLPDDPREADARAARLGLPEGGYLLTLATLEPRKGLDVALAALAADAADLPLLVAGQPGWGGLDLAATAREQGLAPDRVRVLGRVGDADLAVLLSRATMLLAPSLAEGFGLPVLEAMAAGTPVVTSDAPALVEVGGGAPVVVPRGDAPALARAVAALATDPGERARRAAAGRVRAAEYTWHGAAEALWSLYRGLLGRRLAPDPP
jgi:glycosyltransferase involved in cell wall biosynthesis